MGFCHVLTMRLLRFYQRRRAFASTENGGRRGLRSPLLPGFSAQARPTHTANRTELCTPSVRCELSLRASRSTAARHKTRPDRRKIACKIHKIAGKRGTTRHITRGGHKRSPHNPPPTLSLGEERVRVLDSAAHAACRTASTNDESGMGIKIAHQDIMRSGVLAVWGCVHRKGRA